MLTGAICAAATGIERTFSRMRAFPPSEDVAHAVAAHPQARVRHQAPHVPALITTTATLHQMARALGQGPKAFSRDMTWIKARSAHFSNKPSVLAKRHAVTRMLSNHRKRSRRGAHCRAFMSASVNRMRVTAGFGSSENVASRFSCGHTHAASHAPPAEVVLQLPDILAADRLEYGEEDAPAL